jgi:uncharacterized protein (TIGR03437 family)
MLRRIPVLPVSLVLLCSAARAQGPLLTCLTSAVPLTVRAEGVTERVGDIVFLCSGGAPNTTVTGNLTVFLNVPITNRISANNAVDAQLYYDNGAGLQPAPVTGYLNGPAVSFNGFSVPLSPTGTLTLRLENLRANAAQAPSSGLITASLAVNSADILPVNQSTLTVAQTSPSLFDGFSNRLICSQLGSPLPNDTTSFAAFLAAKTAFASTRLTEGFASALEPLSNQANFHADSGERILISYSGFPPGARLFVPTVVAGSDALTPTAGGDLGVPANGGVYAPSPNGSLLLSIVQGADSTGSGGTPVYQPGPIGSNPVTFDGMTEVTLTSGAGSITYEVVDASSVLQESAQFPTFLGLPSFSVSGAVETTENVTIAPVSTTPQASPTAPIPRFVPTNPAPDCSIIGDCGASYYPKPSVLPASLSFNAFAGGKLQSHYINITNSGGGLLEWTATVQYPANSPQNWLSVTPASGIGATNTFAYFDPSQLTPGNYTAAILISSGLTGIQTQIPVTAAISAPPTPPAPAIAGVTNAASSAVTSLVPGSLATIYGSNFAGSPLTALFNNQPATVIYQSAGQINIIVPTSLAGLASAQLIVSVNGASSTPYPVKLSAFAPAIFPGAILNQDYTPNGPKNPAALGSVLQIFLTGAGNVPVTATLTGQPAGIEYFGPAPGIGGLQQLNIALPQLLPVDSPALTLPQPLTLCGPGSEWFSVCISTTVYVK